MENACLKCVHEKVCVLTGEYKIVNLTAQELVKDIEDFKAIISCDNFMDKNTLSLYRT